MKDLLRRLLGLDYADDTPLDPERRTGLSLLYWNAAYALFAALGSAIGGVLTDSIGYQLLFAVSATLRVLAAVLLVAMVKRL